MLSLLVPVLVALSVALVDGWSSLSFCAAVLLASCVVSNCVVVGTAFDEVLVSSDVVVDVNVDVSVAVVADVSVVVVAGASVVVVAAVVVVSSLSSVVVLVAVVCSWW